MRTLLASLAVALMCVFASAPARAAEDCRPGAQFDQATFAAELSAGETFTLQVHERLTFRLSPTPFGWLIQAVDRRGEDRAIVTPPLRLPETNPRNIAGWHFRNAANTGPNQGDVNAPQHRREFVFGPEPMAEEHRGAAPVRPTMEPQPAEYGRGVVVIEDIRLTDPASGERARATHVRLSGCIAWIRGAGAGSEYSGVYRQGFEQSDFYTDDGQGPWWLEAEGDDWDRIMSFRVPRPGRGSFVTVRLTVRGRVAPFDGWAGASSAQDTRIVVEDILAIERISDEAFHAAVSGRHAD